MLGKTDRQLTFADMWIENKISKDSYYYRMREWGLKTLTDNMFQPLYSYRGRPSESPIYMMMALLIQAEKGYSDVEMEETSRFDDRIKYALSAPRNFEGLDAVTLCEFRQRLFNCEVGKEIFVKVLEQAKTAGMFDENNINAIDSFMIYGNAARQSTYKMIYLGIKSILKFCQFYGLKCDAMKVLERTDYDLDLQKPKINWENKDEKADLIDLLTKDACNLIKYIKEVATEKQKDLICAYKLLEKIIKQDVEIGENKKYQIIKGTAKDRIISINDPEMRHGRKTSSKLHDGYKGEIICGGEKGELVIAFEAMPANVADGTKMGELIDQAEDNGQKINKLYGDSAYNKQDEINKRKGEVEVVAKVPGAVNKNGLYTKDDFEIDMKSETIECPEGKTISFESKSTSEKPKTVNFGSENCNNCPQKDKCTNSKTGRTITINSNEEEILEKKAFQQTDEFKQEYAKRANVERTISELTKHGSRQGRFIGEAKIKFQLLLSALNNNIKKLMRYATRKNVDIPFDTGFLCLN